MTRKSVLERLEAWGLKVDAPRLGMSLLLGALTLILINKVPLVEHSFVGAPDRAMQDTAFWLRTDSFSGDADPVLFLDIDDDTVSIDAYRNGRQGYVPSVYVSRTLVADLLRYVLAAPPNQAPKVVILDADMGGPAPDPAGAAKLHDVLRDWAASRTAPPLFMARETFEPEPLGQAGALRVPHTDFDDIVAHSANIRWGSSKILYDAEGIVQETSPFECVAQPDGSTGPFYSLSLQAYEALNHGLPPNSPAAQAVQAAPAYCKKMVKGDAGALEPVRRPAYGLTVNFHMSMRPPQQGRNWPDEPASWAPRAGCPPGQEVSILRHLSAAVVAQAGPDASHDILCKRLLIIGGTNQIAYDVAATSLGPMPGSLVLANATRGLQLSSGGLRNAPWWAQFLALVMVTLAMFFASGIVERIRERYQRRTRGDLWSRVRMLPLNPLIFGGLMWSVAYCIGVVLLLWSMSLGYWGFLSGPAMGSAIGNMLGDFLDEERR